MDDFNDERDKSLIEEREKYEQAFFEQIVDEMIESNDLDKLIAERFEYIDEHFDFEPSPAYERLEEIYYAEYDSKFQEQISDVDDYIDYPEGPSENLEGIKWDDSYQTFCDDFESDQIEFYIERELAKQEKLVSQQIEEECEEYLNSQPLENDYENYLKMVDFNPSEAYEDLIQEAIIEEYEQDEEYMDGLIEQHMKEEQFFIDNIMTDAIHDVILNESYFEKAIDEFIFNQIDMDYEPDLFDYDDRDEFWYTPYYDQPDESVIDSFDSLGDIDYPEGEPEDSYDFPIELVYEDEMKRDFEKYQRRKEHLFGYSDDELPEPEDELILELPEEEEIEFEDIDLKRNQMLIEKRERIESKFKDYFTKDDTLDIIIKEKLKEKKFNK